MEPKVIIYLKRIVKTITIVLIWMIVNTRLGIVNNYAFFEKKLTTTNIIFYIWFVLSLAIIIYLMYKIWRKNIGFDKH